MEILQQNLFKVIMNSKRSSPNFAVNIKQI